MRGPVPLKPRTTQQLQLPRHPEGSWSAGLDGWRRPAGGWVMSSSSGRAQTRIMSASISMLRDRVRVAGRPDLLDQLSKHQPLHSPLPGEPRRGLWANPGRRLAAQSESDRSLAKPPNCPIFRSRLKNSCLIVQGSFILDAAPVQTGGMTGVRPPTNAGAAGSG